MEEAMPAVFAELAAVFALLEKHYRDMQDIEFTVEDGRLWMLQTRTGKRTAKAALKIAVDMANEHLITKAEAVLRVDAERARPVAAPDARPQGAARRDCARAAGVAGRGLGRGGVRQRCGRSARQAGRGGHPRAHRNQP